MYPHGRYPCLYKPLTLFAWLPWLRGSVAPWEVGLGDPGSRRVRANGRGQGSFLSVLTLGLPVGWFEVVGRSGGSRIGAVCYT